MSKHVCVCVSACVLWECVCVCVIVCVRDCVHALTQFEYAIYVVFHWCAVMFMLLRMFSESCYKIIYAGEK